MGKQMRYKHSDSYWKSAHAECSWCILQIIKNHSWGNLKKRLKHKRRDSGRSASRTVAPGKDGASSPDKTVSSSAAKISIGSQIKALISKEISKRKSRHRRSSTCPPNLSQMTHNVSSHDLEDSNIDAPAETVITNGSMMVTPESSARKKTCVECGAVSLGDYVVYDLIHENMKNSVLFQELKDKRQDIEENELIHEKKLVTDASAHVYKDFLDSVDIININKGLLLTLLKDPEFPLAKHFHKQQVSSAKMILTRSISYPLPGSKSRRRGYKATKLINKLAEDGSPAKGEEHLCIGNTRKKSAQFETKREGTPCTIQEGSLSSVAEFRLEGILDISQAMIERANNSSSGSTQDQNPIVVKHVIREPRKKKHCITMDAILHKVPQGHRISEELKKEILKKLTDTTNPKEGKDNDASGYESDLSAHSLNEHHQRGMRRTSSLTEPLDRYCQLYEISFNRDAKHPHSERLNSRTEGAHSLLMMIKSLGRISSLPDLQSYSYSYHNEEFSDILFSSSPTMASGDSTMSLGSSAYARKGFELNVNSESPLQLDTPMDNMMQENFIIVGEDDSVIGNNVESGSDSNDEINTIIADDIGLSTSKDGAAFFEQDVGQIERLKDAVAASDGDWTTADSKLKPGLSDRLDNVVDQRKDTIGTTKVGETTENFENVESLSKHLNYEISHFHMDTKDKAKFNYVRDVLELSGFIGNEFLRVWHCDDLPVDQLVYKEMECDPYEGCDFDHHFLFDLTNEVLLEIYGRSYCYCSIRLSSLSHMRPMPVGRHVLHEVWTHINWYVNSKSKLDHSIDDAVSIDLAKADEWVNLQFHMECVALELEELIFHDLLEEIL